MDSDKVYLLTAHCCHDGKMELRKLLGGGAAEMALQVRALVALEDSLGSVPAFLWWHTSICNSRYACQGVPLSLLAFLGNKHIHTCRQNSHTIENNNKSLNKVYS